MKAAVYERYGPPGKVVAVREVDKPEPTGDQVAATLPHSAVLAVQGLRRRVGSTPKAGDKVLIDGASRNVGPFAVQNRWSGLLLWWKPFKADDIGRMEELIAAGSVTPRIDRTYSLAEAVDALRQVDEGAKGKVVVLC